MFFYYIQFGKKLEHINPEELKRYLPHVHFRTEIFEYENLHIFAAWREGFHPQITRDNIFILLGNNNYPNGISFKFTQDGIKITSSKLGDDFCCYQKEKYRIAITNRLPLFYGTDTYNTKISNKYLQWMLYEGYVGGLDTIFADAFKIPACSEIDITLLESEIKLTTKNKFELPALKHEKITPELLDDLDKIITNSQKTILSDSSSTYNINLPISGGKDSRTCLAILNGVEDRIGKLWTRGTAYSSDVLSAKLVAKTIPDIKHELVRPSYFSPEESQVRRVLSSIINTQGLVSTYDFSGISDERKFKRIMGRLIGLKGDCQKPKNDDLRSILNWPMAQNTLQYLTNEAFEQIQENHLSYLNRSFGTAATSPFANQLYDLFDVMVCRSSLLIQIEQLSGPMAYPLFQSDLFNLSMQCSPKFTQNEAFHFLINEIKNPKLNELPFADQGWSQHLNELFSNELSSYARRAEHASSIQPIKTSKKFPNLSNPLVGNHKLNVILEFKEFIIQWLNSRENDNSINKDVILSALNNADNTFISIFRLSSLLTVALIETYGKALFDYKNKEYLINELYTRTSKAFHSPDLETKIDAYEALLIKHENSIAALFCELQNIEI